MFSMFALCDNAEWKTSKHWRLLWGTLVNHQSALGISETYVSITSITHTVHIYKVALTHGFINQWNGAYLGSVFQAKEK